MNLIATIIQEGGEAAADPSVFNLDLGVSFWTVVIFIALWVVLAKYAFPPILGYAEAREKRIQESLDEAQRTREETQRLLEEQRRELAEAREESQRIIASGKESAEKIRQELLAEARSEQEQILERARQELELERQKAAESLRRDAVDIAIAAASKLIEQRLDTEQDRELVREFLGRTSGAEAHAGAGVG